MGRSDLGSSSRDRLAPMSPRGGKRPGSGRKPTADPRVPFPVRVRASVLAACEVAADVAGVELGKWIEAKLRKAAGIKGSSKRNG